MKVCGEYNDNVYDDKHNKDIDDYYDKEDW